MLTGLRRPGAGSRQPQSQSQALEQPARREPLWGGCLVIVEWGQGLCLWVRNIRLEASLKKGLRFRPKFVKEGAISLGGTVLHQEELSRALKSSPLNANSVPSIPRIIGTFKNNPVFPAHLPSGLLAYFSTDLKPLSVHRLCTLSGPLLAERPEGEFTLFSLSSGRQRKFCRLDVWSTEWRGQCGAFHQNIPLAFLFPGWRADFSADDGAGGGSGDSTDTYYVPSLTLIFTSTLRESSVTPHFTNTDTEA